MRSREDDPVADVDRRRSLTLEMQENAPGDAGAYGRKSSTTSSEGQQEAGLMSLDPELYHVVKKLKEVSGVSSGSLNQSTPQLVCLGRVS